MTDLETLNFDRKILEEVCELLNFLDGHDIIVPNDDCSFISKFINATFGISTTKKMTLDTKNRIHFQNNDV